MKKTLLTFAVVLLAVVAQSQTSIKVHNNGQISLQSSTMSNGIQIPTTGCASFEPNITNNYGRTAKTEAFGLLVKAWIVHNNTITANSGDVFYVLGNGHAYSYGQYTLGPASGGGNRDDYPIENASDLISRMNGYYMDNNEFEGVTPEDLENSEDVLPEALEGLLKDLEKDKTVGMYAEELEAVLPEAVRHDPEGKMGINYDAVVTVLVEAFKEQQARISQLEAILEENGLMKAKKP